MNAGYEEEAVRGNKEWRRCRGKGANKHVPRKICKGKSDERKEAMEIIVKERMG